MSSQSAGKGFGLKPTRRDLLIFQLIRQEGAMTSNDLSRRFWDEKCQKTKAGFQRIRKLIKAGLLERGNPKLLYLSERAKGCLLEGAKAPGVGEVRDGA